MLNDELFARETTGMLFGKLSADTEIRPISEGCVLLTFPFTDSDDQKLSAYMYTCNDKITYTNDKVVSFALRSGRSMEDVSILAKKYGSEVEDDTVSLQTTKQNSVEALWRFLSCLIVLGFDAEKIII